MQLHCCVRSCTQIREKASGCAIAKGIRLHYKKKPHAVFAA